MEMASENNFFHLIFFILKFLYRIYQLKFRKSIKYLTANKSKHKSNMCFLEFPEQFNNILITVNFIPWLSCSIVDAKQVFSIGFFFQIHLEISIFFKFITTDFVDFQQTSSRINTIMRYLFFSCTLIIPSSTNQKS